MLNSDWTPLPAKPGITLERRFRELIAVSVWHTQVVFGVLPL